MIYQHETIVGGKRLNVIILQIVDQITCIN